MTYYSALHYAAKAEKSATNAANSAEIAQTAAAQASQSSGRIIQLGFDGAMEDGVLVFTHAPSGVEVPYELLDDYEYELDLSYTGADLSSLTEMYVKNGSDTIRFVSAEHRSSTDNARVADMDAVMRYNSDTGYRWLFKAAYKVTTNGDKVFLLYPVVAAKDYSDKTNCITEIPQDIKLELNDGTLTLKAGSKVYFPNGFEEDGTTPKFDVVTIASDITSPSTSNDTRMVCLDDTHTNINWRLPLALCYSGNTAPSGSTYMMWYDTTNNLLKITSDGGSIWTSGGSLPLFIGTASSTQWTSIDQVFNGFGYIGSTAFALPGIKFLIPNGRNADGSLKSIESTFTRVHTYWLNPAWGTALSEHKFYLRIYDESNFYAGDVQPDTRMIEGKAFPSGYTGCFYNTDENKAYWVESGVVMWQDMMFTGATFTANITASTFSVAGNFTPKQPFQAVDRNDSSWLSGLGMPSDRYIDLTLLASGSKYTAPANGYFSLYVNKGNSTTAMIRLENGNIAHQDSRAYGSTGDSPLFSYIPARKGDSIACIHTYTGTFHRFRFVYAEGDQ